MNIELQEDGTLIIPLSQHSNSLDIITQAKTPLEQSNQVIFDLADKDILISQDIGFILTIYKQSPHQKCTIINANSAVLNTLNIAQIDHIITVA